MWATLSGPLCVREVSKTAGGKRLCEIRLPENNRPRFAFRSLATMVRFQWSIRTVDSSNALEHVSL